MNQKLSLKTGLSRTKRSFLQWHCLLFIISLMAYENGWSQCTTAPTVAGASTITAVSARINWNAVSDAVAPTYTLEVYTDAGLTASFGTYTAISATSYQLNGLTAGTTYFYQVKVDNTTCGLYGSGNFVAQIGYTPLDVTGYNFDVIANGTGSPLNTSNNSVDNTTNNNAYLCIDYKLAADSPVLSYGLPVNRSLTSSNITGLKYILQDYSLNNSLRLSAQTDSGILTLTQPQMLSNLYLAVASGDSNSEIAVEVQFTDGSSQIITGLTPINWDGSATTAYPAIISNIGRVNRANGAASVGNFKLFQVTINLDAVNHNKLVNALRITKTIFGTETKIPNIFAVSGKLTTACPTVATVTAATASFTSATFSWTLGTPGTSGNNIAYTLEVYTDNTYTTPAPGSPFTGITALSKTVTGLSPDTPYFYRVKVSNGTCESPYVGTGSVTLAYCTASSTTNTNIITNFTTTGGYTNINNTSTGAGYTNFTAQSISKPAVTTFGFTGIKSVNTTRVNIYVDWNGDLDFDDAGETVYNLGTSSSTTFSGTITIPANTPLGNYRMRVRSSSSTAIVACGNVTNGDTEDYTITVVTPPANCTPPDVAGIALSGITASGITVTITAPAIAPTGYLLVRSTSPVLSTPPATGATYVVGAPIGNGIVAAIGTTLTTVTDFVGANTHYYYFIYTYNETASSSCFSPSFSAAVTADATTCAKAVTAVAATNVTANSAKLNWSSIVGTGGTTANYTVELYSDAALTVLVGSYNTTNNYYDATGLSYGATYYYRVKGSTAIASCFNDAWSATITFIALNTYTPLTVTGFNADVIANGTGIAKISTNNSVDAVNNSYIAKDYERASGIVTTIGLDINRQLSNTTPPVKFLLADYGGNNSLRLPATNQSGTLTFSQPFKVSDLYLAVTSGSGDSSISAQVNFQDGTSQSTPVLFPVAVGDWYSTTALNPMINNIGRVNRTDNTGTPETGAAKVFYTAIAILPANQAKTAISIQLTKTSAGLTEPVPNIFAVSAKLIDECPSVATITPLPSPTGAAISWTAGTGSAATSYTIEVYTDAAYTTAATGSPFTGITTTSYSVTGLNQSTQYYYRVKAINAACVSAYVAGTFTTPCQTPAEPTTTATQSICGPATVANLSATAAAGATINWYATQSAVTPLAATDAIATGTYYVSQTASACESNRVAVSVTVNTALAPTAAAQIFCPGATVAQLTATGAAGATFTWSATEGGAALASTTVLSAATYYVTQTVGTCTSPATAVAVSFTTINAPTAAAQTHCSGATVAQLTVTGATGATFTWSATQGGTALATTAELATGTYYVTQTVGSCTSSATTVGVTVTTTPVPTASAQSFCSGDAATIAQLAVTGGPGATFTWYATQGGAALATTTALISTTYYVSQTLNSCPSALIPVSVTINTTTAPTAQAQTFCTGNTVSQLVVTSLPGATVAWSATQGGAVLSSTEALASGTYYVTQTLNGCTSTATPVSVIVNTVNPPTAEPQSFCVAATVSQLTASGAAGATFTWSATQGGAALAPTAALGTGTYFVTQTVGTCSSTATQVSVDINTTPVPGASSQTFCAGTTTSELDATGTNLKWYTNQALTTLLTGTELLEPGTYFVTQTLNACESAPAAVSVTVNTTLAPDAAAQTFCAGAEASELAATGTNLKWYATEDGPVLTGTEILETGTYFVTQTLNDCESIPTPVSVTINTTPAPDAAAQTFCAGTLASELSATGTNLIWYTSQAGTTPLTGTETLETGTYFVTQTLNGCVSAIVPVTVTVNTTAAPDANEQFFCEGETAAALSATGSNLVWYASEGGAALTGAETLVTGTYYVTQTLNDCTSTATSVTVTVNAIPDAPEGQDTQTFTQGATVANLNVTTIEGATENWYVLNDAGEYTAIAETALLEDGIVYYVSQTSNTCESDYFAVTVSVTADTRSFDFTNLKVYPNPTRDIITVANSSAITNIRVVNLLGQTVIDRKANTDTVQIDLSLLSAGTYILQISGEGTSANVKVVKR